ncbi:MAG TPA: methyltransferase domain-containing protein, partial [Solirubrobacteraceae bacterium]|nr:methyltransferase domain-containing protein [Solirubrobacteraceae bacterium]
AGRPGNLLPVTLTDPDEQRAASRESWETAATAWGRRADRIREWGMPVSVAMIDALALQPGDQVLELAAGPGDTGFMAAELIRPGGTLVCSDGADAMLQVARSRAAEVGIDNVEFQQLELEWIDMSTASVDAVLCRWGIMLTVDPEAAAREIRRVLRQDGRAALAVWDLAERNPWATIPGSVMVELGHAQPPDPDAPGMFVLGGDGRLEDLLEAAGFTEVEVQRVFLERRYTAADHFIGETLELSPMFGSAYRELEETARAEVQHRIVSRLAPFTAADGAVTLPGCTLVARAIS